MKPCASPVTHCKYKVALRRNILSKPSGTSASPSCGYSAQCRGDASPARRRALPPGALLPPGLGGVGGGGGSGPPGPLPQLSRPVGEPRWVPFNSRPFPPKPPNAPGLEAAGRAVSAAGAGSAWQVALAFQQVPRSRGRRCSSTSPPPPPQKTLGGGGGARQLLSNWEAA